MTTQLNVLIANEHVGMVEQSDDGRLTFTYDDEWRNGDRQIPLSLSMPLSMKQHPDKAIANFMWNLLPDNEIILGRWASKHECSARNAFALLAAVGEECAGAVQFLTDEKLASPSFADGSQWIDEADIGRRLAELRQDVAAGRRRTDTGQYSLAGAQAKTAFLFEQVTGRWGIPHGRTPTTHILKPPIPGLAGHTENEHFCLRLAQELGMNAANSDVMTFNGEQAIVVERYDRLEVDGVLYRIHQEDMCQALRVHPGKKYENQGGPGVIQVLAEVLAHSSEPEIDRARFMEAVVFNFLIAGTDAHAKNYSMLLGDFGSARLAPFYDVSSILPHLGQEDIGADLRNVTMAMRVADKYAIESIHPRHWEKMAKAANFSVDYTAALLRHYIAVLPDTLARTATICRQDGLEHPVFDKLQDMISQRVQHLAKHYGSEALPTSALLGHEAGDDAAKEPKGPHSGAPTRLL